MGTSDTSAYRLGVPPPIVNKRNHRTRRNDSVTGLDAGVYSQGVAFQRQIWRCTTDGDSHGSFGGKPAVNFCKTADLGWGVVTRTSLNGGENKSQLFHHAPSQLSRTEQTPVEVQLMLGSKWRQFGTD